MRIELEIKIRVGPRKRFNEHVERWIITKSCSKSKNLCALVGTDAEKMFK